MGAPAVVSHVTANIVSTGVTLNPAYTTSVPASADVVLCIFLWNSSGIPTVSTVTDSAGLTWTRRARVQFTDSAGGGNSLEEWYAPSGAGFTAAHTVTATFDRSCSSSAMVLAISGEQNSATPWDVNVSLPASATNTSTTVSTAPSVSGVSTTATTTLLLAITGTSQDPTGVPTPPTGFTNLGGEHNTNASLNVATKTLSTATASQTYTDGSSHPAWVMIVDDLSGVAPQTRHYGTIIG